MKKIALLRFGLEFDLRSVDYKHNCNQIKLD